jgi:hypothetical protein
VLHVEQELQAVVADLRILGHDQHLVEEAVEHGEDGRRSVEGLVELLQVGEPLDLGEGASDDVLQIDFGGLRKERVLSRRVQVRVPDDPRRARVRGMELVEPPVRERGEPLREPRIGAEVVQPCEPSGPDVLDGDGEE